MLRVEKRFEAPPLRVLWLLGWREPTGGGWILWGYLFGGALFIKNCFGKHKDTTSTTPSRGAAPPYNQPLLCYR